jgi:pimeloyl-ACP methyl ester carboxylesterase
MADSPTILLVHGAWHGSWGWERVSEGLRQRGFEVTAVDLGSHAPAGSDPGDLYADVEIVRRAIDSVDGPVVVVAHSYGGVPTTEATAGAGNVAHIVYLTAFMLDEGESLFATVGSVQPDWWLVSDDGRTVFPDRAEEIFYNACPPELAAEAAGRLQPQSIASFEQPVRAVGWRDAPATYVICDQDAAIPVFAQEHMSQRAGHVRRLDADHSPFLMLPDAVVELIAEIAGA